jgi:hypothetical protein
MKKLFWAAGAAYVWLFVACATTNNDAKNAPKTIEVMAAKPMPVFSLNKLGGGSFASTELAGKSLLINFWSPS